MYLASGSFDPSYLHMSDLTALVQVLHVLLYVVLFTLILTLNPPDRHVPNYSVSEKLLARLLSLKY